MSDIDEALKDLEWFEKFTASPECKYHTNDLINRAWLPVINKALRILDLIESDILEDSQCGETGEYGWFITPENRQKIEGLIDEQ